MSGWISKSLSNISSLFVNSSSYDGYYEDFAIWPTYDDEFTNSEEILLRLLLIQPDINLPELGCWCSKNSKYYSK